MVSLFGHKLILLFSGLVLAFLTRKVEVRGLSESREIRLVMFVTTPLAVGTLILRLVFKYYINTVGATYSLGIAAISLSTLGIIFIPKVSAVSKRLQKNPVSPGHSFQFLLCTCELLPNIIVAITTITIG